MVTLSDTERWPAIERLQRTMLSSHPGSLRHDGAEHAVDLALRNGRPVRSPGHVLKNLLRDAGRTILRRQRRYRERHVSAAHSDNERQAGYHQDPRLPEPVDTLIAVETEVRLRDALASVPQAEECLDGLLSGEQVTETARRLGIPDYRVEYVRGRIRQATAGLS